MKMFRSFPALACIAVMTVFSIVPAGAVDFGPAPLSLSKIDERVSPCQITAAAVDEAQIVLAAGRDPDDTALGHYERMRKADTPDMYYPRHVDNRHISPHLRC